MGSTFGLIRLGFGLVWLGFGLAASCEGYRLAKAPFYSGTRRLESGSKLPRSSGQRAVAVTQRGGEHEIARMAPVARKTLHHTWLKKKKPMRAVLLGLGASGFLCGVGLSWVLVKHSLYSSGWERVYLFGCCCVVRVVVRVLLVLLLLLLLL